MPAIHLKWQHYSLRILILRPRLNAKKENAKIKQTKSFQNLQYLMLVECSAFQGIASTFEPGPADAISSFEPYPRPRGRALLCNSTTRGEQSAHSDLHGACTRSHALSLAERLLATLPRHASSVSATVSRVSRHFSNYESPVHKGLDFQFLIRRILH